LTMGLLIVLAMAHPKHVDAQCDSTTDLCQGAHSSLFAIAHSFLNPETEVLFRVTVPGWSPAGSKWGDGNNGFFYQAVLNGSSTDPLVYVPFNGMRVAADGTPELPSFTFIVPLDVSGTNPQLTIQACSNFSSKSTTGPDCSYWSDTYDPVPMPAITQPPAAFGRIEYGPPLIFP